MPRCAQVEPEAARKRPRKRAQLIGPRPLLYQENNSITCTRTRRSSRSVYTGPESPVSYLTVGIDGMLIFGTWIRGISTRGISIRGISIRGISIRGMLTWGISILGMLMAGMVTAETSTLAIRGTLTCTRGQASICSVLNETGFIVTAGM